MRKRSCAGEIGEATASGMWLRRCASWLDEYVSPFRYSPDFKESKHVEYFSNPVAKSRKRQEGKHGKIFHPRSLDSHATNFLCLDNGLGRGLVDSTTWSVYAFFQNEKAGGGGVWGGGGVGGKGGVGARPRWPISAPATACGAPGP